MKVGFDGRVFCHETITGVERYAREIYNILRIQQETILLKPTSSNKYLQHLWTYFSLPKRAKQEKIDILFCPANSAPFNLSSSVRLAVTLHDISFITHPEMYSFQFREYYKWVLPKIIRRANALTTISNHEKNNIISHFPEAESKLRVIPPGISSSFRFLNLERKRYILAVGAMNKHKNLGRLLKAFQLVLDKIPHQLILVGGRRDVISNDPLIEEERIKIPPHRIEFTGYVSEEKLVELYNQAELFVFPSLFEGFGLVPLEAMRCGCPVIVSNTSVLPETCGQAAHYIDPYSPESIANGMLEVILKNDLKEGLVQQGLEWSKKFTYETTVKELITLF